VFFLQAFMNESSSLTEDIKIQQQTQQQT